MVAAATSLPSLSAPDEALIARLFERETLHSLKDLFNTLKENPIENAPKSLLDFCRWSQRDDIKPWLDFHEAQLTAAIRRRRIAKLELLADNSPNPIEARRANTTILRHLSNLGARPPSLREGAGGWAPRASTHQPRPHQSHPSHESHSSHLTDDPDSHESHWSHWSHSDQPPASPALSPSHPLTVSPTPVPRLTPSPNHPPRDIVKTAMLATIRLHEHPDNRATLELLLAKGARFNHHPITDLAGQAPRFHPNGAFSILPTGPQSNYTARIRLTSPAAPHFLFTLTRSQEGPHPNSWLISEIHEDDTS